MNLFGRASQVRNSVRNSSLARLIGVLAGGSLGQRVVATLGIAIMGFGIFKSLVWVILVASGWLLCTFAIQDYERTEEQ